MNDSDNFQSASVSVFLLTPDSCYLTEAPTGMLHLSVASGTPSGDPKKEVNIITKEFLIQALYRYKFFGQAWTEVTKGHAASVFVVAVYPKMIAVEEY